MGVEQGNKEEAKVEF